MIDFNKTPNPIIIGCNYHTSWQKYAGMRFVLSEINNDKARLETRTTKKSFWTDISDLIFISSEHNRKKANQLITKTKTT